MRDRTRATTSDSGERVVMPSARPVAVTNPCRTPLARISAAATASPCASRIEASAKIRCTIQSGSSARIQPERRCAERRDVGGQASEEAVANRALGVDIDLCPTGPTGPLRQMICCSQARPEPLSVRPRQHSVQEAGDAGLGGWHVVYSGGGEVPLDRVKQHERNDRAQGRAVVRKNRGQAPTKAATRPTSSGSSGSANPD